MGIASEIGQHLLGSPERALGVVSKTRLRHDDDPVALPQPGAVGGEGVRLGERRELAGEAQAAVGEGAGKVLKEEPPEQPAQHLDRQE